MEAGVISALVDIGEDPREKVFDLVTHARTEHQTAFLEELMKKCTTKQLWGVGLKVGIIRSDPKVATFCILLWKTHERVDDAGTSVAGYGLDKRP